MDKWILSELNQLIKTVDKGLENYEIVDSARAIEKFTDMLSNWYVRRCRERYWGSEWTEDKQAAYMTLYTVLTTLAKVAAPFVPFISESIYLNLVPEFFHDAPKSVHLCDFPVADEKAIDLKLNSDMEHVLDIVVLGRSARNSANVKNRQPLSEMYVVGEKVTPEMAEVICDELNVKKLLTAQDISQFARYEGKPQLRTLGPKYGKLIGAIRQRLADLGDEATVLVNTVNEGKTYTLDVEGRQVQLTADDLLISSANAEGYCVASDHGVTVVLNTVLTDDLVEEGLEREIVSKIQTMRKESGFVVTDHIEINYKAEDKLNAVFERFASEIMKDTLADSLTAGDGGQFVKQWDVNGLPLTLGLTKSNK